MKLFCKLHLCPAFLFPKVSDIFACFFFIHTHPRPFAGLLLLPDILIPLFYMNFDIFALYFWFSAYKKMQDSRFFLSSCIACFLIISPNLVHFRFAPPIFQTVISIWLSSNATIQLS